MFPRRNLPSSAELPFRLFTLIGVDGDRFLSAFVISSFRGGPPSSGPFSTSLHIPASCANSILSKVNKQAQRAPPSLHFVFLSSTRKGHQGLPSNCNRAIAIRRIGRDTYPVALPRRKTLAHPFFSFDFPLPVCPSATGLFGLFIPSPFE